MKKGDFIVRCNSLNFDYGPTADDGPMFDKLVSVRPLNFLFRRGLEGEVYEIVFF